MIRKQEAFSQLKAERVYFPWKSRMVLAILGFLVILAAMGCDREETKNISEENFEIKKEYKRGPVILTVMVSQKEITIADRLKLILEVRAKEEYEVELPVFGEKLVQFGIVDYSAPFPRLMDDGMVLSKKAYELEPFLSGEYKIPPMKLTFWKKGEEEKHEIESEELIIQVKSLLPERVASLQIKGIKPPVGFPEPPRHWIYGLMGSGILAAMSIVAFLVRRRRRGLAEVAMRKTAHEVAYEDLEALLADKLIEKGQVKDFYLRLSYILRHYIENRFALRAPERTTEEFLVDLRSTEVLNPMHKELLKEFLHHCDMVKFAEVSPTNDEIQRTFDACKRFIVETDFTRQTEGVTAVS